MSMQFCLFSRSGLPVLFTLANPTIAHTLIAHSTPRFSFSSTHEVLPICLRFASKSVILIVVKGRSFVFPQDYRFRTTLTEIAPQTFLLDIHGKVLHPSNANTLRVSKRYVLLLP